MSLRRLEIILVAITLFFACFLGGFFTGRSTGAVNIVSVAAQNGETHQFGTENSRQEPVEQNTQSQTTQNQNTTNLQTQNQIQNDSTVSGTNSNTGQNNTGENGHHEAAIGLPTGGDGKININLASQSELTDLPGIGSVLAARIVDYRRQHGVFSRIEDIRKVSGIGAKRYEAIEDKITVG